MVKIELLAPAKNLECGCAAIQHGADAVYIGASRFGARAAAGNSVADIAALTRFAHQFGAKVYVTVNTIIYDSELEETRQLMAELKAVGVDAFLVQDMGLLQSSDLSAEASEYVLHASTQTDNRTVEKVRWLRSLGFRRVVLARELSASEIAEIHSQVPDVELEVFVHGALCVSYSGVCYASQACFGRSANRGECAQFCRMKFTLEDADGQVVSDARGREQRERYLLSLKDMNQIDHLEELIRAGATSFKIEGRLKDISYVKNVTAAYSQRLNEVIKRLNKEASHANEDASYERSSLGDVTYQFVPDLNKTFNRGYTSYFLHDRQRDIWNFDSPKAMGEAVGVVKELRGDSFNVASTASFHNGDGLCFLNERRELVGFRANRVSGNRIWPFKMPQGLRPGLRLYRNQDQEMDRVLARADSAERHIPITMRLVATAQGFRLEASLPNRVGDDHQLLAVAEIACEHQQAQKSPRENIMRQLSKLGDTVYCCEAVEMAEDFNYFIPNSQLSELRRQLVEEMSGDRYMASPISARCHVPVPMTSYPYLNNISNEASAAFYREQGLKDAQVSAYELKGGEGPMMQCRHCLRYALGFCVKHGGEKPRWKEPLRLKLGDGRRFPLEFDCRHCQMNVHSSLPHRSSFLPPPSSLLVPLITLLFTLFTLTSCYNRGPITPDAYQLTEEQWDSISFYTTHHYTQNYNFVVSADSLVVVEQKPDVMAIPDVVQSELDVLTPDAQSKDSLTLRKHDHLVVADIRTVPADTIDSVWVKVARDQLTQGWIHESELLPAVSPDDPISQFIDFFSDAHLLIFLAFLVVVMVAYGIRRLLRLGANIVHFRDIPSFYPTLLCLLVATSAVYYSSIQLFAPEMWRHFYYHPSLNPFALPWHLGLFVTLVWTIVIVTIATIDDVTHHLSLGAALLYLGGLAGVCAVDYVIFSVTTLSWIGYPLLVAYYIFALKRLSLQKSL